MPLPEPVLTVTVRVVPDPLTAVTLAPVMPVEVRLKSATSTLMMASEKVTVKFTLARFVGLVLTRTLETTFGAVLSIIV